MTEWIKTATAGTTDKNVNSEEQDAKVVETRIHDKKTMMTRAIIFLITRLQVLKYLRIWCGKAPIRCLTATK